MILTHAQFVFRNMETVGRGPDSAIASGSASATGVSLAVAPPSRMTWRTNSNVSTGVRKTNCACAKIIAVRNFATSRKIAVKGGSNNLPQCSCVDLTEIGVLLIEDIPVSELL